MLTRAIAVSALLAMGSASAAEVDDADGQGWSGEGEFGLVMTTGNSETETLNSNLNAALTRDPWVHKFGVSALVSNEDDNTTAERYVGSGKSEYHTSERSYWFASLRYEDDRFSGFDYQGILTAGYGRTLVDRETSHLDTELGLGVRRARPAQGPEEAQAPSAETDAVVRGAVLYWWQFTDNARFQNEFLVEAGEENTFLENEAGVRLAVNDRLAVKLGLAVRHNTEVPEGIEQTDTVSTVNLVYSFQ